MIGFQKVVEPFFNFFAKAFIINIIPSSIAIKNHLISHLRWFLLQLNWKPLIKNTCQFLIEFVPTQIFADNDTIRVNQKILRNGTDTI